MKPVNLVGEKLKLTAISKHVYIYLYLYSYSYVHISSVGRKLFTKRAGIDSDFNGVSDAEDITDLYKFKEGTEEERMAVLNAARGMEADHI